MVDDTDKPDDKEEYELWKLRELKRIKRDKEEREAKILEEEEIERRRNMTDAEIQKEKEKEQSKKAKKTKYTYLQKYYHKGAFYQDDENENSITNRDYSAPTLEDKFDKSMLPEIMQVKKFGRAGQTKWTHLSKEDTSQVIIIK